MNLHQQTFAVLFLSLFRVVLSPIVDVRSGLPRNGRDGADHRTIALCSIVATTTASVVTNDSVERSFRPSRAKPYGRLRSTNEDASKHSNL